MPDSRTHFRCHLQGPGPGLSIDIGDAALGVWSDVLHRLGMADPGGTMDLFFRPGGGHIRQDGIYLPEIFSGGSTFSPEDHFRVYLAHAMFHFAAQVSPGLNPAPTAFLNEGLAQSQAEGRVLKAWFGFDYHELAGAALRRYGCDGFKNLSTAPRSSVAE